MPSRILPLDVTPTAFGNYLLLERIALGGMAEVFLAKSFGVEGFERLLAIKRILPQLAADEAFIGMFIDEARIAGQLSHANIASIHELGKVGDAHYIAMEHVPGKDLLTLMNRFRKLRKRMPPAMPAYLAARVAEALAYAHDKRDAEGRALKLIHRDVSPPNILVSYDGAVKLIDFGVAKARRRTTTTDAGVLKGKFGYMSPEQVRGKKVDHRSDLFSVGICLHEMLTLERLFANDTDIAAMEMIRSAKIAPPSSIARGVPAALDEIVMRALARNPSDRYESASALREDLDAFLATQVPRFTRTSLAQLMRHAFAEERADEDEKLASYARLGRSDFERVGGRARREPVDSDPGFHDEPTHLFFSAEVPLAPVPVHQGWLSEGNAPALPARPASPPAEPATVPARVAGSALPSRAPQGATRAAASWRRALLRPIPLYAAGLAATMGFGVAVTLGAMSAPAHSDAAPPPAVLAIDAPSQSLVRVDGVERGRAPLTLDALEPGVYAVEVIADGYSPVRRIVTLASGQRATLAVVPLPSR